MSRKKWPLRNKKWPFPFYIYSCIPIAWLSNTAPAVHPCEAKQHQFGEFWFLRVALLFARTKIEYAISQHYNFVEM